MIVRGTTRGLPPPWAPVVTATYCRPPTLNVTGHPITVAPFRPGAAGAVRDLQLSSVHLHARLAEGNDERARCRHIAHRLPVVAAFGARTRIDPLAGGLLEDVGAILGRAALRIDRLEHVLE